MQLDFNEQAVRQVAEMEQMTQAVCQAQASRTWLCFICWTPVCMRGWRGSYKHFKPAATLLMSASIAALQLCCLMGLCSAQAVYPPHTPTWQLHERMASAWQSKQVILGALFLAAAAVHASITRAHTHTSSMQPPHMLACSASEGLVPCFAATQGSLTAMSVQGLKASLQAAGIVISGELSQEQLIECPICYEEYMSDMPPPRCEACMSDKSGACKACRAKACLLSTDLEDRCRLS